jgi:hypothetical protein
VLPEPAERVPLVMPRRDRARPNDVRCDAQFSSGVQRRPYPHEAERSIMPPPSTRGKMSLPEGADGHRERFGLLQESPEDVSR